MKHLRNYSEITQGITGYIITLKTPTRRVISIEYRPTLSAAIAFAERIRDEFGYDIVKNYNAT